LKKSLLFTLLVTLIISCRPDIDTARWDVDALVPLVKTRIDYNNLFSPDSNFTTSDSDLVSIVIRNELANLSPGEVAPPLNKVYFNTVKISSIDLGTRVINRDITLGAIAQEGGLAGQIIIANNGTNQVIPPVSGFGPNTFQVDATEFFQTMTLKDGWLILRMENGLPAELTNIQYEISNQSGGVPILQNTVASLPPAAVHFDSIQLVNNITINGQLVANLINVDFPGTGTTQVPIDTSDALQIRLTVDKLDPISATAIFPDQVLFQDTSAESISAPGALLTSVHVNEGVLFIDAASTVEDIILLEYLVPSGVRNGQVLGFVEQLAAAPALGITNTYVEVDVIDYNIDLTGFPNDVNVFNQFYTVFSARVDSSGNLITLSLEDSVFIQTGIKDLKADRGYGFIGYDTTVERTTVIIDVLDAFRTGTIELDDVLLSLEIENYIGAPISFRINAAQGDYTSSPTVNLNWSQLGQELQIPRAVESNPGDRPVPGRANFSLDKGNSNVQEVLQGVPDSLTIEAEVYLNPGVANTDLSQFLYSTYGIEASLNIEIPLNLSMEDLLVRDTAEFNYNDFDASDRLQGGQLTILAENFYPFELGIDLVLLDANKNVLDTMTSADRVVPAIMDNANRAIAISKSKTNYALTNTRIEALRNTTYIVFDLNFNTADLPEKVKIYSDNYLDMTLVGDLSVSSQ
jgi:hypothetical protein